MCNILHNKLHTTSKQCSALLNTVSTLHRTVLSGSPNHSQVGEHLFAHPHMLNPVHCFCTRTFCTSEDLAAMQCAYRDISTEGFYCRVMQCLQCIVYTNKCKTPPDTTQLRFSMQNAMDAQKQSTAKATHTNTKVKLAGELQCTHVQKQPAAKATLALKQR